MTDGPKNEPIDKLLNDTIYWQAISQAFAELNDLKQKEKEILVRKAQLNQTLAALWPLVTSRMIDISSFSLANAIRFIINSSGRSVSAMDVRSKLKDWNYDLSQFENPLASIHTAMNRMLEAGEITKVESEDGKKKFEAGPEIKSVLPIGGDGEKE